MAAVIGALRAVLSASIAEFTSDLGKAGKAVEGLDAKFKRVGAGLQKTGAVMSAAVTAPIALFAKQSLGAFQKQEDAIAAVNAALKSMGPVAGFTSKQLQDMASALQKTSTFGDEEILHKVTANLLTFGNVQGEVFKRAQQVTVDLSARLGQDLQSSAVMLGKALNDPVKGLTALSRVGVAFTEQQKEQIKAMVEAGDAAGAQRAILAELEKQYGGQAAAMAATTKGQVTQLTNAWGDFTEKIGQVVAQVLPPLVEMLGRVVQWLDTLEPVTIAWGVALGGIAAAVGPVLLVIGTLVSALGTIAPALVLVGKAVTALIAATGPIGLLLVAIAAVVTVWQNWETIGPIVQRMVEAVIGWLKDKLGAALDWVGEKVKAVTGFFKDMYDKVVGGSYVPDMINGIQREFARLPSAMVAPARNAAKETEKAFRKVADAIGDVFEKLIADGKITFDDLRQMAAKIVRELFITPFIKGFTRNLAGAFSNMFGGGFAGAFAGGGTIPRGQWGIVGERGPEPVFAGGSDLTVFPNGSMGGGVTQVFNISTPDADSFRLAQRQISRMARQRLQV